MKRGGRITGHLTTGRGTFANTKLALIRKAASSRDPYTRTGKPRLVQHFGKPAAITLPRMKTLEEK